MSGWPRLHLGRLILSQIFIIIISFTQQNYTYITQANIKYYFTLPQGMLPGSWRVEESNAHRIGAAQHVEMKTRPLAWILSLFVKNQAQNSRTNCSFFGIRWKMEVFEIFLWELGQNEGRFWVQVFLRYRSKIWPHLKNRTWVMFVLAIFFFVILFDTTPRNISFIKSCVPCLTDLILFSLVKENSILVIRIFDIPESI